MKTKFLLGLAFASITACMCLTSCDNDREEWTEQNILIDDELTPLAPEYQPTYNQVSSESIISE